MTKDYWRITSFLPFVLSLVIITSVQPVERLMRNNDLYVCRSVHLCVKNTSLCENTITVYDELQDFKSPL